MYFAPFGGAALIEKNESAVQRESSPDILGCGALDAFGSHVEIRSLLVTLHCCPKLLPASLITDSVQQTSEGPSPGVSLIFERWNGF